MRRSLAALFTTFALATVGCSADTTEEATASATEDALAGDSGFDKAKGKMDEIREDLASNQSHLRGVLDAKQTAAYSAAFFELDRVVDASNEYAKKATTLASNLSKETAKLRADTSPLKDCGSTRYGVDKRITTARDLYGAAKKLATANVVGSGASSPAYAVRDFYVYLTHNDKLRSCLDKTTAQLEKDLGANHAQTMVQVKLEDPTADALEVVERTFEPFDKGSDVVKKISGALEHFAKTQDAGAFGRAISEPSGKAAGSVLAVLSLGELANDLAHRRYKDFLEGALKGGAGDVAAIADAVSLLEGAVDSGRAQSFVTRAAGFSKLAGKIAGGVGVVTGAIQLLSDLNKYEGDRFLHLARIASDAAALQASIVAVAGLAELVPVAGTIVLLTMAVFEFAEYWNHHKAAQRRNKDTKAVLRAIGMSAGVADTLADADDPTLRAYTEKGDYELGLAPRDVQALAALAQKLPMGREAFFTLADDPLWIGTAAEIARIWGLSSGASEDLVETVAGSEAVMVRVTFDGCLPRVAGVFANKQGTYDAIATCKKNAPSEDRAGLDRLETFLRAH